MDKKNASHGKTLDSDSADLENGNNKSSTVNPTRLAIVSVFMALAVIVMSVARWDMLSVQRQSALNELATMEKRSQVILARQLAAQAQSLSAMDDSKQTTALLLAIQSMRMYPSGDAAQTLQNTPLALPVSSMQHERGVTSLDFSPDGAYVVSGSWDGVARVWESSTGREIARMMHTGGVTPVAFSPNGKYVVSGGCDTGRNSLDCILGSARVWDAQTGQEIARFTQAERVMFVAFSPDGKYVVSGGCNQLYDSNSSCNNPYAVVWNALTGEVISRFSHKYYTSSVAFSPDGKYIVSGGCDHKIYSSCDQSYVRVFKTDTGREVSRMLHDGYVMSVAFSPDGNYVVAGCSGINRSARVWEALTGKEIARLPHYDDAKFVAFSPDNKFLVTADSWDIHFWTVDRWVEATRVSVAGNVYSIAFSHDGKFIAVGCVHSARVYNVSSGKEISRILHEERVQAIAFSPDGRHVVSGGDDSIARLWDFAAGREIARQSNRRFASSSAFSPDGRYVVSAGEDQTIHVWEASTGVVVSNMTVDARYFAYSPDGRYGIWMSEDNTAHIVDIFTGKEVIQKTHNYNVMAVAFNSDGRYVVSAGFYNAIVWGTFTGMEIARFPQEDFANDIAFSFDDKYVVTGGRDRTVRVWETSTGKEILRMICDNSVNFVAFSPDGRYVASGSADQTIRVWDVFTGIEIFRAFVEDYVTSIAFSPDSKYLISGGGKTVRIWEVATGREISRTLHDHVVSVAFSADGKYALSGNYYDTVRVWKWRPEDLISDACSRVTRNLTRMEWQQYIGDTLPYQAVCPNLPLEEVPIPIPLVTPSSVPTMTTSTPSVP